MEMAIINLKKSILAGICIAIGSLVYLNYQGPIGAILFATGLFSILLLNLNLYTGKIGYINSFKELLTMGLIILGNFIGCCIMFAFPYSATAEMIIGLKMFSPIYLIFVKSFLCGILIYIAVEGYKKKIYLITLLSIPTFILIGAEHSIANICFFIAARYFSFEAFVFFIIVIIGNALGSICIHRWKGIL